MARPVVMRFMTRPVGGAARNALLLDRDLGAEGFSSRLVSGVDTLSEGPMAVRGQRDYAVVEHLRRGVHPSRDVAAFRRLSEIIRQTAPDVVHTHQSKAGALGRMAASRSGVPAVVHTYHGHVLRGYFAKPWERAFIATERRLARRSSALVAVSPAIRDELLTLGVGRTDQWRVIPIGIELDAFTAITDEPFAAQPLTVGIVGRLAPVKDHTLFLDAAARVAAHRPDTRFVVAGDGEARPGAERHARRLGLDVEFTGWVDDLPALYSRLDVVVCTSTSEGTPVSLIEAGAAARPVVSTDVGGVRDIVSDTRTGIVVTQRTPAAVARAITTLAASPERARDMGRQARDHVTARYSAHRMVRDMAGLYQDLLSHHRTGAAA